jgi:uncharacterized protein (TIGR02145 family)
MKIGNKILVLGLGLAVAFTACKKKTEEEATCVTPAAPTASNNSPMPVGSAIQLTATAVEGATYSWTGPNKFSSTLQNPTVTYSSKSNLGEYSVVAIVNGCMSAKSFTYVTSCDTPDVTTNSPVAMGGTINFSAVNIPGATYSWTKVGTPAFTANEPSFSLVAVSDSVAGTYQLSVTYGGCTTPVASTTVVILPQAPAITGTAALTTGGTLTLTATSQTAGVTYHWTGPNGFDTIAQSFTISPVGKIHAGEYSVVAMKNGLTSAAAKKTVTVAYSTTTGCAGVTSVTSAGVTYNTVEYSTGGTTKQCWLKSNLKQSASDSLWTYDEWLAASTVSTAGQGMCPVGFHMPTDADWTALTNLYANDANAFKAVGQTGVTGATNTSNFSVYFGVAPTVTFFTSTVTPANPDQKYVYMRQFSKTTAVITRDITPKTTNTYVRCIKD